MNKYKVSRNEKNLIDDKSLPHSLLYPFATSEVDV